MSQVAQTGSSEMLTPEQLFKDLYPFGQYSKIVMNSEPNQKVIKINPHAGNSKYIPIGEIEMQLDEIFCALWQTKNFQYSVIANEVVGSIELHFYHPILKDWLVRIGTASVMIQQDAFKKDENGEYIMRDNKKIKINPKPSDVDAKIKNTLVKDFPHLKAECIKNAAKSLGKYFGRDLNRGDMGGQFDDMVGGIAKSISKKPLEGIHFEDALQLIKDGKKNGDGIIAMFALTPDQIKQIKDVQG